MIYTFADCELDTDQMELRRSGAVVPTQPQVFDLLQYLVEHADRMVSRDEIFQEIWHGRFVSDAALSSRIKSARKAIGDSGRHQVLIKTVPRRGFRFAVPVGSDRPIVGRAAGQVKGPAVAVLPFENMSGDSALAYFCDGLTDDIITALAMWRSFPVIARTSSFVLRGTHLSASQIAKELGASYLLEGSIWRMDRSVRVAARLVDGSSEHHIWADRYESGLIDFFSLQNDIVHKIAAAIEPKLARAEVRRSHSKRPEDFEAWDLYLRGMAFIHDMTPEANAKARDMFSRAIGIQADYAEAYAGIAWSYNRDVVLQSITDRHQPATEALGAARTAKKLDPDSAMAHRELSTAYQLLEQYDDALSEANIAAQLNPSDAYAQHSLGNMLDLAGNADGIPRMEAAQTLNPVDVLNHSHLSYLARAYFNAGELDKAVERANRAIRLNPNYAPANFMLALALCSLGRTEEAHRSLQRCEDLQPGLVEARKEWKPYADQSSNDLLRDGLRRCLAIKS